MTTALALLTSVQKAEAVCLTGAVLLVLYIMHSLNLFKRE
jgi:hypothetical protein